tara:strand:- start:141 stop:1085 length:945 start_codon:yes stop_codon:yes gene_type:complete
VGKVKIGLLDVDSKIPNLALMKISHFHKELGNDVCWYDPLWKSTYDSIYASTIFEYSDKSGLDAEEMYIGGTGWDYKTTLPPEIEKSPPDYTLYNYPHNIGFTMRGCRFRCKFCVVPQKEGTPYEENTVDEIWRQRGSNFVVLLDNDFFGNPSWDKRIDEIRKHKLKVCFSQGLNIRIITEEQAVALASVEFRNLKGKYKQVHFAWDQFSKGTEKLIDQGLKRCWDAGITPRQMAFFVLVGFNTTPDEDMYRVQKLASHGCDPYVMPYNKEDPYQKKFARWVNRKEIFKTTPWEFYKRSRHDHRPKNNVDLFDG